MKWASRSLDYARSADSFRRRIKKAAQRFAGGLFYPDLSIIYFNGVVANCCTIA